MTGITAELLKLGGKPILKVLQQFFNSVILESITPKTWDSSVVVLLFKKGDNTMLKTYIDPSRCCALFINCFQKLSEKRSQHRLVTVALV